MNGLFTLYSPRYATVLVYMLQNTEYQVGPYLKWYWRTQNFSKVMYRRQLNVTKAAKMLRLALLGGMFLQIAIGLLLIGLWKFNGLVAGELFGLALLVSYPVIWAHLVVIPLILGRELRSKPNEQRLIAQSKQIFARHPAVKIAVAGSYGKTSMKEMLLTVLSEGKKVAATPANKNVASSHARFASKLDGDEDILIIEYGEGAPGDVVKFAKTTQPTHGVITGLAPAHLDRYKTLQAAGEDIFALASYLKNQNVYANGESKEQLALIKKSKGIKIYDADGALGWKVKGIKISATATEFTMTKGKQSLKLSSGLLGKHQVGPLCFAAALALELGITEKQVKAGVAKTVSYEHRMQPRKVSGAWIIDDTYNGNLEGIRVGTELLASLEAKRKIYVTPGLVDQGKDAQKIHIQVGALIAKANPDLVVLMSNSVNNSIEKGLKAGGYKGKIQIETDPLNFYMNLDQFVANGDIVLMQNDWTDNYA